MKWTSGLFQKVTTLLILTFVACAATAATDWGEPKIQGTSTQAIVLGKDLDGDGDPDEVEIRLEVIEITEEVYPGEYVKFWVFAPEGAGMNPVARAPSPTIRVEEGDRVRIILKNTHYFPHTIHLHGTIHPNDMDGVPGFTQAAVKPGESFSYEFIAKNPGTHFYHCHVQADVHVNMGLAGMLIIEPNRPANLFNHLVLGAGRIQDLAKATKERYDREYSLVYTDIDDRLNRIPMMFTDPREIEKRMHRDYDSSKRQANIFMLNGRSFPFTLRDTPIEVKSGERIKLRILNAGERSLQLHVHGHHPILTHVDGHEVPFDRRFTRDVFTIGAAQRIDLELLPGSDDDFASGPGVWIMHDHTEKTTTNKGINPGGDITALVYAGFMDKEQGLPRVSGSLKRYFDPEYYRGNVPIFDPNIFHTTVADYEYGWDEEELSNHTLSYPVRENSPPVVPESVLDSHQVIAKSCAKPRGFRRIVFKGGVEQGLEGKVFGFQPARLHVGRCVEVEVVFENTDQVRHALMIPGLSPMFVIEFTGPGEQTARFITPDEDVTLEFHCHVETHAPMGMRGMLVVGRGSEAVHAPKISTATFNNYQGVGIVVAVDLRKRRIVLDHEEIQGFMAAMVMGFQVASLQLLKGMEPGTKVRFSINTDNKKIVAMEPLLD